MKRFAIAVYDNFEGELKLEIVSGVSAAQVLRNRILPNGEALPEGVEETVESLTQYAYGCAMPMEVVEVPDA